LRIFRTRGKVVYPLQEILLLCLLAVLAGAEKAEAAAAARAYRSAGSVDGTVFSRSGTSV